MSKSNFAKKKTNLGAVNKVVNENTSQLNGILVTKGAIKAQLIFILSNLFKVLRLVCVYLFYSFIYFFFLFLPNSHIKFFTFLRT